LGDDDDCKSGQVAAGAWHACAVTHGDGVACWGNNLSGELGTEVNAGVPADTDAGPALKPNPIPVLVAGASAVELTAGCHHTCARRRDGQVDCWGANYSGQLGNGTTENSSRPVNVSGLTAIQISAGCDHTCALTSALDIVCWGDGSLGQLGTGIPAISTVPVVVPGQKAVQIAAGSEHAAALRSDGTVISWGLDQSNLFGIGEVHTVSNLIAHEISAGSSFTCARTERSEVTCWGWNVYGQLGNGTTVNNDKPQNVISGLLAIQVAAGMQHACARSLDGHVVCWGNGYAPEPRVVPSIENTLQISAGFGFTCARTQSALFCWGQNESGQLGNGTTVDSPVPVAVELP
jgi:alpha-tubulin suppressor-like RCC1 family protein